jgi:hypothetical protein
MNSFLLVVQIINLALFRRISFSKILKVVLSLHHDVIEHSYRTALQLIMQIIIAKATAQGLELPLHIREGHFSYVGQQTKFLFVFFKVILFLLREQMHGF